MRTKQQEQIVTELIQDLHSLPLVTNYGNAIAEFHEKVNKATVDWIDEEKEEFFNQNPIIMKQKEYEALKYMQEKTEFAILACPSGDTRNFLTEINILLLKRITIFVPKEREKPT